MHCIIQFFQTQLVRKHYSHWIYFALLLRSLNKLLSIFYRVHALLLVFVTFDMTYAFKKSKNNYAVRVLDMSKQSSTVLKHLFEKKLSFFKGLREMHGFPFWLCDIKKSIFKRIINFELPNFGIQTKKTSECLQIM